MWMGASVWHREDCQLPPAPLVSRARSSFRSSLVLLLLLLLPSSALGAVATDVTLLAAVEAETRFEATVQLRIIQRLTTGRASTAATTCASATTATSPSATDARLGCALRR